MIKAETYTQDFNMDISKNITRFNKLDESDSLSAYLGHTAQQSHNVYQVFRDFLEEIKPSRILEIGTALGGFTQFLNITVKDLGLECPILTYDIYRKDWYTELINNGIDVRVEDVFLNSYSDVKQEVKDYIKQDGTTLVLCDGGYKVGEFRLLSELIKNGDYIMAHDYCEDGEKFERDINKKIWNWHEISDSDIKDSCEKNNLKPYNKEKFDSVVWVCKIKENEQ